MRLNFRHGIVRRSPNYIVPTANGINLTIANNAPLEAAIAHRDKDYLHVESQNIINAWTLKPTDVAGNPAWLYIKLDNATASRTFGYTRLDMIVDTSAPGSPANDQHWFDTTTKVMKVYSTLNSGWEEVLVMFIAKYLDNTISHYGIVGQSQVGIQTTYQDFKTGSITYDQTGTAIRVDAGTFLTTEEDFFVSGNVAQSVTLESEVVHATASEPIPAFAVVVYSDYGVGTGGKIRLASYEDVDTSVLGMTTYPLSTNDIGTVITTGNVTNTNWDFEADSYPIGAKLYVGIDGNIGTLVAFDPADSSPLIERKAHVARIIGKNKVQFSHNYTLRIGTSVTTPAAEAIPAASTTVLGLANLWKDDATDPLHPRLVTVESLAAELAGITLDVAADEVTTTAIIDTFSSPPGIAYPTDQDVQTILQNLYSDKMNVTGGTFTGTVTFGDDVTFTSSITLLAPLISPNGLSQVTIADTHLSLDTTIYPINITTTTGLINITSDSGNIEITTGGDFDVLADDINILTQSGDILIGSLASPSTSSSLSLNVDGPITVSHHPDGPFEIATQQYVLDQAASGIKLYTPITTSANEISPLKHELNSTVLPLTEIVSGYPILSNSDFTAGFEFTKDVTTMFSGVLKQHEFPNGFPVEIAFKINADDFINDADLDFVFDLVMNEASSTNTLTLMSIRFTGTGTSLININPGINFYHSLTSAELASIQLQVAGDQIIVKFYIDGVLPDVLAEYTHNLNSLPEVSLTDGIANKGVYWKARTNTIFVLPSTIPEIEYIDNDELTTTRTTYSDAPIDSDYYNSVIEIVSAPANSEYINGERYFVNNTGGSTYIPTYDWLVVNADYIVDGKSELIYADTSGSPGPINVFLPSNPAQDDTVRVADYMRSFEVAPCTVWGNGYNLEQQASSILNVTGSSVEYTYDVTEGWVNTSASSGSGIGLYDDWTVISDDYDAVNGDRLLADTTLNTIDVTLPSSPLPNDRVTIVPLNPTYDINNLTIISVDKNIMNSNTDLIVDQVGWSIELSFVNDIVGWAVIKQGDVNLVNNIDDSGVALFFRLTDGSDGIIHTHSVALTTNQMNALLDGSTPNVVVSSTVVEGHSHYVTVEYSGGYYIVTNISSNHATPHVSEFAKQGNDNLWNIVDTNYSATPSENIVADTATNGSLTILLPPGVGSPATIPVGTTIKIAPLYPSYETNPVTIDRNGQSINGSTNDILLDENGASVELLFMGGTVGWVLFKRGSTTLINVIDDSGVGVFFKLLEGEGVGIAPHSHTATITYNQMISLLEGSVSSVPVYTSYTDTHLHEVTAEYISGTFSITNIDSNHNITAHVVQIAQFASGSGWKIIDADYPTAMNLDRLLVDSDTIGSFDITLPEFPNNGDNIQTVPLFPSYAANPVTILRNGNLINGALSDLVLNTNGISIELLFVGGTIGWAVIQKGETTIIQTNIVTDVLPNSMKAVRSVFDETSGTFSIGLPIPDDSVVVSARIFIIDDFDAGTPTLKLGSDVLINEEAIASESDSDLLSTGLNLVPTYFNVSATDTQLQGVLTLNGATAGSGEIIIEYYVA